MTPQKPTKNLHSVDPPSSSEWLPGGGGQGFALRNWAAVDRDNLTFCENFITSHGKSDVLDP